MTHYIFIRHGITEWIEQGILHGISESPLSEFGRWQAQQTANALKGTQVNAIYSSSLGRVMQTAEPISKMLGTPIQPLDELREMNFGWLEGKPDLYHKIKQYPALLPGLHLLRGFFGWLGGESTKHFRQRVITTWQNIQENHPQGKVLIVAHAGILRVLFKLIYSQNHVRAPKWMGVSECSISEIRVQPGKPPIIIRINDTQHLQEKLA